MSITNAELIGNALRGINVISEVGTPSAEQGKHGLRKLNQMMELLKERDVDVGWFTQSSTSDDCPIPDWAELSLESMLSVLLAPACASLDQYDNYAARGDAFCRAAKALQR